MADEDVLATYSDLSADPVRSTDELRSVYSPAAYLADLLQLVDDYFTDAPITRQRPGIREIPLDPEHTDTELPYLDVVNDVLAARLRNGQDVDVDEALRTRTFPFTLPFSREDTCRRLVLRHAGVAPVRLYRLFATDPDPDVVARELLGLTLEDVDAATKVLTDENKVAAAFGLREGEGVATLTKVARFRERTGLSAAGLDELLFQNLSAASTDAAEHSERMRATAFFVNQGEGPAALAADGKSLTWGDATVPWEWFERARRFVRFAGRIGMSFTDLDLILRTCCGNVLNDAAVRTIATVRHLQDLLAVPVDVVCSLVAAMPTLGVGDGETPADLVDRTFNVGRARAEGTALVLGPVVHASYAGLTRLTCVGDLLDPRNSAFRRRVAAGAGLSDADLLAVVTRFRAEYASDGDGPFDDAASLQAVSLLFRVGTLVRVLEISVADLFGMLDVLRSDPSIRTDNPFDLLFDATDGAADPYRTLAGGPVADGLWLIQILHAVARWAADNGLSGTRLAELTGARAVAAPAAEEATALDGLYQRFQDVLPGPAMFASERFSHRDAAVVHRVVSGPGGPVSGRDDRLVWADEEPTAQAAYAALAALGSVGPDDLRDLAIEDRLVEKIFANLVLRGYVRVDGSVVEDRFPPLAEDFVLAGDFAEVSEAVFAVLSQVRLDDADEVDSDEVASDGDAGAAGAAATDEPSGAESADADVRDAVIPTGLNGPGRTATAGASPGVDVATDTLPATGRHTDSDVGADRDTEAMKAVLLAVADTVDGATVREVAPDPRDPASFFPSDLQLIEGLAPDDVAEVYDNLVYNRYVDADGNVLRNDLFADPGSAAWFAVDADLGDAGPAVWHHVRERAHRFVIDPLRLDPAIFADLRLDAAATRRLVENLRFTGRLDAEDRYTDKAALLALGRDGLELALEFYPLRRRILDAMQNQVGAFRAERLTVTPEALRPIADAALARLVLARLEGRFVMDGTVPGDQMPAVLDGTAELDLGPEFSLAEEDAVRARLAAIVVGARRYRLDPEALAALGLARDEVDALLALLRSTGDLTDQLMAPRDRVPFFLDVHGALEFTVVGFEDYAKDVFFLLHAVATETAAALAEIAEVVARQARAQADALGTGLQDAFGVPRSVVEAMCAAICGDTRDAVDQLMAPVLEAGVATGRVDVVPADPAFRRTFGRLRRFAGVAAALALDGKQTEAAFRDRDLVGKFPEQLALPAGVTTIDALLESGDGRVYVFSGPCFWVYSGADGTLVSPAPEPLTALSRRFAGLVQVRAAYVDPAGGEWLVGRDEAGTTLTFRREGLSSVWARVERTWGDIRSEFTDPERIDTAFRDRQGTTYLFSGDQYVRYSGHDYTHVDPGYPRSIADNWPREGHGAGLPDDSRADRKVDASFQGRDGVTYLFRDGRYAPGPDGTESGPVTQWWGLVRNTFAPATGVDAALTVDGRTFLFRDDQVIRYTDGLANGGVLVDEGYPVRLGSAFPGLSAEFERGLDAAFAGPDGVVHLFRAGSTVAFGPKAGAVVPVAERWGRLGPVLPSGTVDAAFVGMDGKTYLFSGDRYLRYSGSDYTACDLGYPRTIAEDWGGMRTVTAAFVLDGRTYLIGAAGALFSLPVSGDGEWAEIVASLDAGRLPYVLREAFRGHGIAPDESVTGTAPAWVVTADGGMTFTVRRAAAALDVTAESTGGERFYVRYSGSDYGTPDPGHPRPTGEDSWWNIPESLREDGASFVAVDAVFTGADERTYLFAGERFVVFDNRERWWSPARSIADDWDSLPFERVDAAFVGTDGRTYVFWGSRFVRYSGHDYDRLDDRYPADVAAFWGRVPNAIATTGRVDAAVVVSRSGQTRTYLFSGDQYVRYSGTGYETVDSGYPRRLTALTGEPGFAHLSADLTRPVDAVIADRGSVTVFTGGRRHVVSDSLYRHYEQLLPATPGCAFVEDGAVLVEDETGWHHVGALESDVLQRTPARPRVLRDVPEEFRTGLSAVLHGMDGNTYLFRGRSCFDVALGRAYPAAEDWGRIRNVIGERGRVDAAFVGRDGRTYVFGGDQFVVYGGETYVDAEIEGRPRPIAEHWAGLRNVEVAFVEDGWTYVCEAPDAQGHFRYLLFSGDDYTRPEPGCPLTADAGFWGIPEEWRAAGFDRVRAVLAEDGSRFHLTGTHVLQLTVATGAWSGPHPLHRLWPGLPFGVAGNELECAFLGADGAAYVFAQGRFTRHNGRQATPAQPVAEHWSRIRDDFADPARGTAVDAAFVHRGSTYLFSGDTYVRYSGPDHRYVDPGYPQPVVALRQEPCFANLPDTVEEILAERVAARAQTVVDAVVSDDRSVHLFIGPDCHVVSDRFESVHELGTLGTVRNILADTGRVDAALVLDDHTYLFSGDQYVRYTGDRYTYVDEGYPKTFGSGLPAELGVTELPERFGDGIDAALAGADGRTYLFSGRHFVSTDTPHPEARPIAGTWGVLRSAFSSATGGSLDAAFVSPAGRLYAFAGDQYVRYADPAAAHPDDGYPRSIGENWGGLPPSWDDGIDAAFRFGDRTYLVLDGEYVRYSDPTYRRTDNRRPRALRARWGCWVDYQLGDLRALARFVRLDASRSGADGGLAGLLSDDDRVTDPHQRLSTLFGWDLDELRWVVRRRGFLPEAAAESDLGLVARLVDLFALAGELGGTPSTLHEQVWRPLYADGGSAPGTAAGDALQAMVTGRHTDHDRAAVERELHQELSEATRDALVAAVLAGTEGARTAEDLYDLLFIDVEMGGAGTTSAVREAIAAVQLFFHRYFLNLEQVSIRAVGGRPASPEAVRAELRRRWEWMGNYRVWEANRKVYLYPENYLRPELRSLKTPAFAKLEGDLLQGELTDDSVRRAYASYLEEYTEVSRLTIAGGYVYEVPRPAEYAWNLVLFGRTKTDPRRFYYRQAAFPRKAGRSALWQPWSKVDVRIDSDRVYPVFAFDRVFVFWAGLDKVAGSTQTATFSEQMREGGRRTYTQENPTTSTVKVYYSFYDLNGRWTPPQQLTTDPPILETLDVSDIRLQVEMSEVIREPGDATRERHDNVVIRCSYELTDPKTLAAARRTVAFLLTAELFTRRTAAEDFDDQGIERFTSIFDEPVATAPDPFGPIEAALLARRDAGGATTVPALRDAAARMTPDMPPPSVVMFNNPKESSTDRWFAFDFKGGSFLCKPAPLASAATFAAERMPVRRPGDRLPAWRRVAAGFTATDGTSYVFDGTNRRFVSIDAKGVTTGPTPIADRWGRTAAGFPRSGVVDAVFAVGEHVFVVSGAEYARFSGDAFGTADVGYPKPLSDNDDGLPRWDRVDAGFTGLDGHTYLFLDDAFVDLVAPRARRPVRERWGRTDGDAPGTGLFDAGTVTATLVIGEHTYLVSGDQYVRYTGDTYEFVDLGYPLPLAGNPDGLPETAEALVFVWGDTRYDFDNAARTVTVSRPGEQPSVQATDHLAGERLAPDARIDAACRRGTQVFLVSGSRFMRYTLDAHGAVPAAMDVGYPKDCAVPVDALVVLHDEMIVFVGDRFGRVPDGQELDTPIELLPVEGGWGNLPREFRSGVDGACDTGEALYLFAGERYVRYPLKSEGDTPPPLPYVQTSGRFEIIRLTAGTAATLNQRMFSGGVGAVVDVATQETTERPSFDTTRSAPTVIKVRSEKVGPDYLPAATYLDFESANGLYYWEIFFHAPLLIAQALSAAQRHEDALTWFGYMFDPTRRRDRWRFLPFRETDVTGLVDTCRTALRDLGGDDDLAGLLDRLEKKLAPVFAEEREVQDDEGNVLRTVPDRVVEAIRGIPGPDPADAAATAAWHELQEAGAILGRLARRYELMVGGREAALGRYLEDPFDPHAIAAMRPGAYRRAVMAAYVDNLLDWGDALFRQFTGESIDQARMLYVLARDLLGRRPEHLGQRPLREARNFGQLTHSVGEYDFLLERAVVLPAAEPTPAAAVAVHASIAAAEPDSDAYFHIPENSRLAEYWTRVDDRLGKIRRSLDILGVARPAPLFEPPIDPAGLVRAAADGRVTDAAADAAPAVVPHHRFSVVLQKAQELTDKVVQFGGDLLLALEKRDGEALSVLQNAHDGVVLGMTRAMKEAAVGTAAATLAELAAAQANAEHRRDHYKALVDGGQLPIEKAQVALMMSGIAANGAASTLKLGSAIAYAFPQSKIGLFIAGFEVGGEQTGSSLDKFADFSQALAATLSGTGEVLGIYANHQRMAQDWQLQLDTATNDLAQIAAQQEGARLGLEAARQDLAILEQQIRQSEEVARFLTTKFGTAALYQWMAGQLSGLYLQAYGMALDLARAAERALQFERGLPEAEATVIAPAYWDGRHGGLLAGDTLALDLQRLSRLHLDTGGRALEITKVVSLLDHDPVALLGLRSTGTCEFTLTEALFDHDFPGQFRRQVKTLGVTVLGPGDATVPANALLTQLQHKTVLRPDVAAVKHLLDTKGAPPASMRADWRPGQQVALSPAADGQNDNGLFDLRYDDDRYLPFEGTGAVSTWRLELPGRHDGYHLNDVRDVVVTLRYTAQQGDPAFTGAVKGLLRPYPAQRYIDVANEFSDEWVRFLDSAEDEDLVLRISPGLFPDMASRQIGSILPRVGVADGSPVTLVLNGNPQWELADRRPCSTTGLSVGTNGSEWRLAPKGERAALTSLELVLTYTAAVQ